MTVTTTGWSGFWNGQQGVQYATVQKYSRAEKMLNKALRGGYAKRRLFAPLNALTGVVAGSSKALTYKRVAMTPAPQSIGVNGGQVALETISLATGNSTSGDVTHLTAVETATNKPASYPADRSGVRSGGRAGSLV